MIPTVPIMSRFYFGIFINSKITFFGLNYLDRIAKLFITICTNFMSSLVITIGKRKKRRKKGLYFFIFIFNLNFSFVKR